VNALKKLTTFYNPATTDGGNDEESDEDDEEDDFDTEGNKKNVNYVFNSSLVSDPGLPKTFKAAISGPERKEWLKACEKEIKNFNERNVWQVVDRKEMGKDRMALKTRWIYRKKEAIGGENQVKYKARLVVKGYEQIPGVDFTESFAPVANDTTIRTALTVALYKNWIVESIDVEAAFLNADLEEEVFIEIPEGFFGQPTNGDKVLKLRKAVYGLVQAPRAWFKDLTAKLIEIGMKRSRSDPCLFTLVKGNEVIAEVVVYVDDCIVAGSPECVKFIKEAIKEKYTITELGPLKKHLGVNYERKKDGLGEYFEISMTEFTKAMIKDFKEYVGRNAKAYSTPAFPGTSLPKMDPNKEVIELDKYRSAVGKLLWLVKKLAVDCSNIARELASHMDRPGPEHWKALERVIGFLSVNNERVLKLRKPKTLTIEAFVDSDYATNKDTRRSVTGYLVTIGGALVSWQSNVSICTICELRATLLLVCNRFLTTHEPSIHIERWFHASRHAQK
jgi:hypothetical protein